MAKLEQFEDWVAICEVKARYCRFLDKKRWEEWGDLFAVDLFFDLREEGGDVIHGRDNAVAFVRQALQGARTAHHVHTPEISIDGERAEAIWAMQDRVLMSGGAGFIGFGHYHESYLKQDGVWRITSLKLTRLHIDPLPGAATAGRSAAL